MNRNTLLLSFLCLLSSVMQSNPSKQFAQAGITTAAVGISAYYSHKTYKEFQIQQIKNKEIEDAEKKMYQQLARKLHDLKKSLELHNHMLESAHRISETLATKENDTCNDKPHILRYDFNCNDDDNDESDFACGEKISVFIETSHKEDDCDCTEACINSVTKNGDTEWF